MRSRAALAFAALATIAAVVWFSGVSGARRSSERAVSGSEGRSSRAAPPLESDRREAIAERLRDAKLPPDSERPPSLRGTEVDGALAVDSRGELVVEPALLRFFDYFLSASGEEPAQELARRIAGEIDARLAPDPAARAHELLERYLAYRERARELTTSGAEIGDLTARWDAVRRLRRDVFGEQDAEALFGEEEAATFVALAQRGVAADSTLTAEQREERIAELERQLPDAAREARDAATAPLRLAREEADLRAAGADPAEIRALRERHFDPEAADRLAALDLRRAEWQRRVDDYRATRVAIDTDVNRSAAERARAAEALLAERFSPPERLRVQALDRLAAGKDG